MNVAGDLLTAIAYFVIPFGLYYYSSKRQDLSFRPLFVLFALFILSCGTTHVLDVISVWHPIYYIEGVVKIFTASVSLFTAYVLIKNIPNALAIPSIGELKNLNRELTKSNHALQRIAYATSHSMKEPIRGLTIYAQRIKSKNKSILPVEALEDLDFIAAEGKRMYELIESLMDYAQITSDNFPLKKVRLNDVLQNVSNSLKFSLAESNATINFKNLPMVNGNETLLNLLFQKLISNSIRFRSKEDPVINISAITTEKNVLVTYTDNSLGFEREYSDKVFEMFSSLQSDFTKRSSGMGLAITKRIVDLHGGTIDIDSKVGGGIKFEISFKA